MSGPVVGQEIEVRIEKGVYRGLGLARHDGQVILVPRGLPGDRLCVRVTTASRGLLRASSLARLEDGAGRRASECSVSGSCGGCAYQDLDYPHQLSLKEKVLRESLARAGAPFEGDIPLVGSPERGWRMRASLHGELSGGRLRIGLHEEASHRVVEFDPCLQLSARANLAVTGLRRTLASRPGLASRLRTIDLAESPDERDLVVGLRGDFRASDAPAIAAAGTEV
ncbi:MAG TPA: TRAM domain-containing protein, partial [Vicinamibacteria bacterium]|nr:TRAM domain-containing protein [Vicinamibacteria bacterium]